MVKRLLASLIVGSALVVGSPAFAERISYEVAPGDTLGGIAAEYGVSVSDLRRWNPRLRGDLINVGQELTIHVEGSGGSERIREEYSVRSGDTGLAIARRYNVSLRELQRWNSGTNLDRLRIGQRLNVYVESGGSTASRGSPNRGRLRGGIQLTEGTGYTVRDPSRAYATPTTIAALRNGIARVSARYIDIPSVVIHDLSFEGGGSMRPHSSHQNGLDADVSYYHVGAGEVSEWREVTADELDVRLQWYLFKSWIDLGLVEYIFVDWDLQAPMYQYAAARGATQEQLEEWFQYPNRERNGIIRHESGHSDHFHVRFHPLVEE